VPSGMVTMDNDGIPICTWIYASMSILLLEPIVYNKLINFINLFSYGYMDWIGFVY